MIQAITLILLLLCAFMGSIILIRTLKDSKKIFIGEETLLRKVIINSLFTGLSGSLEFAAVILFLSLIDQDYTWKPQGIFISTIISLIVGLILFLSTLWGFFIVGKYRNFLQRKLIRRTTKNWK